MCSNINGDDTIGGEHLIIPFKTINKHEKNKKEIILIPLSNGCMNLLSNYLLWLVISY